MWEVTTKRCSYQKVRSSEATLEAGYEPALSFPSVYSLFAASLRPLDDQRLILLTVVAPLLY